MFVSCANDVKIYNLSAGRSLPEWLSDRKRRRLQQKDVDIRRRIELIQDFQMPDVSSCVHVSRDGQFIYTAGTYRPRIRCYDVHNLSLKFERCLDSEVIKMELLSDGYEKVALLEEERFLEFHVQYGHYYRVRIPKFGRDMVYHPETCDLYVVASGPDVYRLNLEQGRFMAPLRTESASLSACAVNPEHGLFVCGSPEGKVEAWDHRSKKSVGLLDCAWNSLMDNNSLDVVSVSSLKFKDALTLAVGTGSGKILLYDIRSNKPLLVKDQRCGLPIKTLDFIPSMGLVVSMDERIVKFWHEIDGTHYTAIEPGAELNHFCLVPGSGLMLIANESPKILTYFLPSLGTAPKWCSFLDNITEELEEDDQLQVYDDYKFVTLIELEELGLSHLIGSNLLRAYMHGYFLDNRLYKKAVMYANPFAYEKYRKEKIRQKLDEERSAKIELKKRKLPKINRDLAERLHLEEAQIKDAAAPRKKKDKEKTELASSLLRDNRFKALFENPDFQVNPDSEEFKLMYPALSKLETARRKRQQRLQAAKNQQKVSHVADDVDEGTVSDSESPASSSSEEEDEREFGQQMKIVHEEIRRKEKLDRRNARLGNSEPHSEPGATKTHTVEAKEQSLNYLTS